MTELLPNYVCGTWASGTGPGTPLFDPVLGTELVRVDATGLDIRAAFGYARDVAAPALRALTYRQRAAMLAACVKVLQAHRDRYDEIATANSGTVKNDSAVDINGAIFTLAQYAKWGDALGDATAMRDGEPARLGKDGAFQSQHIQVPTRGVALLINAFNFPAWGLWEKAAPALLSGVPVIVKPATATAWLTQQMVRDVVAAAVLPAGALSIVCGSSRGLMDALQPFDVVSFTGSAETAAVIRTHAAITTHSVRANVEADSLNSAILLPGTAPGSAVFDSLMKEAVREMTVKSGQKCTAIRRIFVPAPLYGAAADAIASKLAKITVGNPRHDAVRMGSLVSSDQLANVRHATALLRRELDVLHDGSRTPLVDADPAIAACVGPTLLGARDADAVHAAHDTEVFGPVATLLPYRDIAHAITLAQRGRGSLVTSLYGEDHDPLLSSMAVELASSHGRVHVVTPAVAQSHTGHGNVMPHSLHGGPGRAGGGEELGGLRALGFYHRRAAVQATEAVLGRLA